MVRKAKEKYAVSFAEMAVSSKGNNNFLEAVNLIIDWKSIDKIFKKYNERSNIGALSYSNILLFKVILLQTWYNLSDPAVEEQLNDRISFIKFLKISIDSPTPDHSTISRFRTFLLKENLYHKLFKEVNRQLILKNLIVKNGAIVDATVIESARRPRKSIKGELVEDRKEDEINETSQKENKVEITYSDDIDAAWLIKRGKFHYGYKGHHLVNYDGYFLGGHVTGANVSDMNQLEQIIKESDVEKGTTILADKGYMSKKNIQLLNRIEMKDGIMRKKLKNTELTAEEIVRNKEISKIRYRIEQSFGLLKQHFGYEKMRYIGKDRCNLENTIKMLSFNLKKAVYSIARDFGMKNKKIYITI